MEMNLNLNEHKFLMQIAGKHLNQIHTNESSTPHSKLMHQQHPEKISSIINHVPDQLHHLTQNHNHHSLIVMHYNQIPS